nr:PREDICTED: uncharacterized protein LOC109633746 isoform X1 [Paralichthys olivaceus]
MRKRSPMAVYPSSNSVLFDTVPDTTGFSNSVTLKGFTMKMEEVLEAKCEPSDDAPPQGELGILSVNSLRRSVSQVIDGKSLTDDGTWDPNISGHDSGMVRDPEYTIIIDKLYVARIHHIEKVEQAPETSKYILNRIQPLLSSLIVYGR